MDSRNLSLAEAEAFYFSIADAFVKRKGPILPLQKVVDSYPQYLLSLKNGHPNAALTNSLLDSLGKLQKFWEKELNNDILQKIMDDMKHGGTQQAKSLDEVDTIWLDTMKENMMLRLKPQEKKPTAPDLFEARKRSRIEDFGPAKKAKHSKAEYLEMIIKVAAQIDSLNKTKEIDTSDKNEYDNRQQFLHKILYEFIISSNLTKDFQTIIDTLEACSDVVNRIPKQFKYGPLDGFLKLNLALGLIEKTRSVDDYPLDAYNSDLNHALVLLLSIEPALREQNYNTVLAGLERIILDNSRDITDDLLIKLDDKDLSIEDKIKACDKVEIEIHVELAHYERLLNTGLANPKDEKDYLTISKSNLIYALDVKAETLIESAPLENYSVEKHDYYWVIYESAINIYNEIIRLDSSLGQNKDKYPIMLASTLNTKGGLFLKAAHRYLDEIVRLQLTAVQQVERYHTVLKLHQEACPVFIESLRVLKILSKELIQRAESVRKTEYNLASTYHRMGYIYAAIAELEPNNALTHLKNSEKCYKQALDSIADIDDKTAQKDGHDIFMYTQDYALILQQLARVYDKNNETQLAKTNYEAAIQMMGSLPIAKQVTHLIEACKISLEALNSKSNPSPPPPPQGRRSSI